MNRLSSDSPRRIAALAFALLVLAAMTAAAETRVLTIYFHGSGSGIGPDMFWPGATAVLYQQDLSYPFVKTSELRFCGILLDSRVVLAVATEGGHSHYRYSLDGFATPNCPLEFVDPDAGWRTWNVATGEALMAIRAAMAVNPGDTFVLNLVGHSRGGVLTMTVARAAVSDPAINAAIEKINILAYDPVPGVGDPIGKLGVSFQLPPKVSQYVALYARHHLQFSMEPVIPYAESPSSTTMWMSMVPGSHTDLVGVDNFNSPIAGIGLAIGERLLGSPNWGNVPNIPISAVSDEAGFLSALAEMWSRDYTATMNDGGFVGFSWLVPCHDDMIRADTLSLWRQLNDRLAFVAPYRHVGHNAPWWCAFIWINVEQVFWLKDLIPPLDAADWATLQSLRGSVTPPADEEPPVPLVDPLPPIVSSCPVIVPPPSADDVVSGTIAATTSSPLTYAEGGTWIIEWTYTDGAGNSSTQEQSVTVTTDAVAPRIESPANITRYLVPADGASYVTILPEELGTAIARDECGADVVTSGVPQGNRFPLGTTTLTHTATDVWENTATAYQTVTIAIAAPPAVTASTPADATSCGAVVTDAALGTIPPIPGVSIERTGVPAGNLFPVGTTTVTWTASDASGHTATATQTVTVVDATPPRIAPPAAVTAFTGPDADSCTAVVGDATLGTPDASDHCELTSVERSGVPEGNVFPVGTTTIVWKATDAAGLTATATQTVTVVDDTPPGITPPPNVTVSTAGEGGACGAVVAETTLGTASATDNCELGAVERSGVPAGSSFPIGTTILTWTATDASGNTATAQQTVTVVDATPPALDVPGDLVAPAGSACTATVSWTASATDCTAVTVVSDPPSGSTFNLGTTRVTVTATDAAGNSTSGQFDVTVVDDDAPAITDALAAPAILWPPNHKLVDVTIGYASADNCTLALCTLSVSSNEATAGTGDGDTAPDWEIVGPHQVRLRAERAGSGSARVYTITISCADGAGNITQRTVDVVVPHARN